MRIALSHSPFGRPRDFTDSCSKRTRTLLVRETIFEHSLCQNADARIGIVARHFG